MPLRLAAFVLGTALFWLGACQPGADFVDDDWRAIQAYVDEDARWHAEVDRIARSDEAGDAKAAAREALGEHPDITAAVAAARAIVTAPGHVRLAEAAEFLVDHPYGLSETAEDDIALGVETLAREIGPDWSVVERYEEAVETWNTEREEIFAAELEPDEQNARLDAVGRGPTIARAVAAAVAVLDRGNGDTIRQAAEFLVSETTRMGAREQFVLRAAQALADQVPDYDNWPETLQALDFGRFRASERIDAFIEDLAARATDPVVRATALYYLAEGLVRSANEAGDGDWRPLQERALAAATGLSAGIEDQRFVARLRAGDDDSAFGTFAEAESGLVYRIEHATVGGTLPEFVGTRLDGTEEALSDYAGKVVLIDFWATWCGPCIAALPDLRELVEAQPADRFALLAISVDAELDEVTEFQEGEPMPWPNWHVGATSEIAHAWRIRAYPTYMLANEDGAILARTSDLGAVLAAVDEAMGA